MQGVELDHDKYSAYLNQHLFAADAGVQAFKAAADTWKDTKWESSFLQLHEELKDSHAKVKALISDLGYETSTLRNVASGLAAVAGRLNPINLLRNEDGIATQAEFDALAGAVRAHQMMWDTLVVLSQIDERLDAEFCRSMVERCEDQRRRIIEINEETVHARFTRAPGE